MELQRLPAGWWWVGDICYVLHDEWNEVCHHTIVDDKCLDGTFALDDGRQFAMFRTAHGDGVFKDMQGREYCVDSGSIGCVRLDHINMQDERNFLQGGHAVEMTEDFTPGSRDGILVFGPVVINTDPVYDEDAIEEDFEEGAE